MSERSGDHKRRSIFVFVAALVLLATGLIAFPIGLFLLAIGEVPYGCLFVAYGIVAAGIAMFGSEKSVLAAILGVYLPPQRK
jgi:hypothetical protein